MPAFRSTNLRVVVWLNPFSEREDPLPNVKALGSAELRPLPESTLAQVPVDGGHELRIGRKGVLLKGPDEGLGHGSARLVLIKGVSRGLAILAAGEEDGVTPGVGGIDILNPPTRPNIALVGEVQTGAGVAAVHN